MEWQFLILWMVVTAVVPAYSAQCADPLDVFGGGCLYATYSHAATKPEADGCCSGSLTIVAPAITQLMDYASRINNSGPHHTAFTMMNSKLYLHNEEINTTSYSIYWMDDAQPTGNVSCIAAQHVSGRLVLLPVSCSDQLPFVCLSADNDSCNSCSEEEQCVPDFTKYACITNCRALPTPTPIPTPTPTPTSYPQDDSTHPTAENYSCSSCSEQEECVAEFTANFCTTKCSLIPTPTTATTTPSSTDRATPTLGDRSLSHYIITWFLPIAVAVTVYMCL